MERRDRRRKRGAVQMEYVIVAVLIAAACAAAVIVFGRSILAGFIVAERGGAGDGSTGWSSQTSDDDYRKQLQTNMEEAEAINKKFSDLGSSSGDKK